eukprot:m.213084 g.213084  ORF g.213084 m.213084 type:complete len:125 (+) comp39783_c0_seq26:327-701(+)
MQNLPPSQNDHSSLRVWKVVASVRCYCMKEGSVCFCSLKVIQVDCLKMVDMLTTYDLFLASQSVRQGSVSSTHYNIIYDTCRLKPACSTYKLTSLYYNWPGTIRVPQAGILCWPVCPQAASPPC